jgi:stage V sporulation protein AA
MRTKATPPQASASTSNPSIGQASTATSTPPPTLYLRLRKRVRHTKQHPILLMHVAQLIVDPHLEHHLMRLQVYEPKDYDGTFVLVDMLRVVSAIKQQFPELVIEYFGEPHTLVDLVDDRTGERRPNLMLFLAMCLLLFIGSGLAIMNFHEDVSMPEVHRRIYELVTGTTTERPYLLQIPYSIGLGLGMVLFFNQWFKKKFSEEPSPLEVELYMYQESMNQYMITEEYRKMHGDNGPP